MQLKFNSKFSIGDTAYMSLMKAQCIVKVKILKIAGTYGQAEDGTLKKGIKFTVEWADQKVRDVNIRGGSKLADPGELYHTLEGALEGNIEYIETKLEGLRHLESQFESYLNLLRKQLASLPESQRGTEPEPEDAEIWSPGKPEEDEDIVEGDERPPEPKRSFFHWPGKKG